MTLEVAVPAGTTATVHLPGPGEQVELDGRPLESSEGVTDVETREGQVLVTVGSGEYTFTASLPNRVQRTSTANVGGTA